MLLAAQSALAAGLTPQEGLFTMPAIGPTPHIVVTYTDYGGEKTTTRLPTRAINAVGLVEQQDDLGDLTAALDAITLGVRYRNALVDETINDNTNAVSKLAQRENKLLVQYQDDVTQEKFTATFGTVDLTKLNFAEGSGDRVLIADGASAEVTALIAAFEAVVNSPAGNAVTVIGMRFVGRNS